MLASLVAEVTGRAEDSYDDLIAAAGRSPGRLRVEPGVAEVDDTVEAPTRKLVFVTDQEKAALNGVSVDEIARTLRLVLSGGEAGTVRLEGERNPLRVELRLPRSIRSSPHDLAAIRVKGRDGQFTPLSELGRWEEARVDQTIYHKNLERVVYVTAETLGRTPAECVLDVTFDRLPDGTPSPDGELEPGGWVSDATPRPLGRADVRANGGGVHWSVPEGIRVAFNGEGEWKITLDVFRDLGLAFGAAMVMIYVILVMQTGSFLVPLVVMLAIPLTVLGVMPGFWLLNHVTGQVVGGHADPVLFTATAMIGMIALSGIVTRDAIILVDFIGQSVQEGPAALRRDHGEPRRPDAADPPDRRRRDALEHPDHARPDLLGAGLVLIFGLIASTIFTLFVIPVSYWLIHPKDPVA